MPLGDFQRKTYISIRNGMVVKKQGDILIEKEWVEGVITNIRIKEDNCKFGPEIRITINDGKETFELQLLLYGILGISFIKCCPNIDFTKPVQFVPKQRIVNDIHQAALFLNHGGNKIEWYYTKEHSNGIPEPVQKKVQGKMKWDFDAQREFLVEMFKRDIIPLFGLPKKTTINNPSKGEEGIIDPEDGMVDDLPF